MNLNSIYQSGSLVGIAINTAIAMVTFYGHYKSKKFVTNEKNEIEKIAEEVKKYKTTIIKNNDLKKLSIVQVKILEVQKKLNDLHSQYRKSDFSRENAFETYDDLTNELNNIKTEVSTNYSKIEEDIIEIKKTLNKCVTKKQLLEEEKQREEHDYFGIEGLLDNISKELKKIIESLSFQ